MPELIERRGDESQSAALYDDTALQVYGMALAILRDRSAAEEVTCEVYLETWLERREAEPRSASDLTRLSTITHRRAVARLRDAPGSPLRPLQEHPSTSTTALLARLSTDQRNAVALAWFDGRTDTEIDTALNWPPGLARRRIREGLLRLR